MGNVHTHVRKPTDIKMQIPGFQTPTPIPHDQSNSEDKVEQGLSQKAKKTHAWKQNHLKKYNCNTISITCWYYSV